MKLIEDLGMREYGTQGYKARYGLYECPVCREHFELMSASVNKNKPSMCTLCTRKLRAKAMANDKAEKAASVFVAACSVIHNNKYDYSLVKYRNSHTNVAILCPIHGQFYQKPSKHKRGQGCPKCAEYGFNQDKSAILYYLRVTNSSGAVVYKIGITNRSVQERFNNKDLAMIKIIKTWVFSIGADAAIKERAIIEEYINHKYFGPDILSNGNSELFTCDILGLDLVEA